MKNLIFIALLVCIDCDGTAYVFYQTSKKLIESLMKKTDKKNIYSSSMSLQDACFISVINVFTDGQKGMTDREKTRL